jgi:hypothetical protein
MATPPPNWDLAKSARGAQAIPDGEIYVDTRLRTTVPSNQQGYLPLFTTAEFPDEKSLIYYAIQTDGKITFKKIDEQGNTRRQFNTIKELDDATNLDINTLKTTLNDVLIIQTQEKIVSTVDRSGGTGVVRPQQEDVILGTVSASDFEIGAGVFGADKKKFETLRYPAQIMDGKGTDYLMIQVQEYVRNKSTENKLVRANTKDKLNDSDIVQIGSIILPIPSSIQDGNSVSYADGTLDSLSAAALQGVTNTITDFSLGSSPTSQQLTQQFTSNLGRTFNTMMDAGLKGQFIRSLASQAVSSIPGVSAITPDQFLARQTGGIMNPNMELLFNGVTLRSFKFSFKMTPRDEYEGGQIKKIIRNLKINMAPQTLEVGTSKKNNFIRTPNVFKLTYMKGSGSHPFLHKFKTCALTDMAVNYTGEGLYATYSDATPISIIMDLTFKELEPIYDTDYFNNGELSDDTVGY